MTIVIFQCLIICAVVKAEAVADRKWTSFPAGDFPIHVSEMGGIKTNMLIGWLNLKVNSQNSVVNKIELYQLMHLFN